MPAVFPPGSRHLDVRSEQPARARALLLERRLVRAATIFGLGVHVIADGALDPDRVARELSQTLGERVEVEEIAPQLEDVFVELTRRAQLDDGTRAQDPRA
jgi:hypothetical protein